jgi:Zn-dependent membrane protease YugP
MVLLTVKMTHGTLNDQYDPMVLLTNIMNHGTLNDQYDPMVLLKINMTLWYS